MLSKANELRTKACCHSQCTLWARPCARPFPTILSWIHHLILFGRCQYSHLTDEETTLCEVREPALCLAADRLDQDGKRISYLLLRHSLTTNSVALDNTHCLSHPSFCGWGVQAWLSWVPLLSLLPAQTCGQGMVQGCSLV